MELKFPGTTTRSWPFLTLHSQMRNIKLQDSVQLPRHEGDSLCCDVDDVSGVLCWPPLAPMLSKHTERCSC